MEHNNYLANKDFNTNFVTIGNLAKLSTPLVLAIIRY